MSTRTYLDSLLFSFPSPTNLLASVPRSSFPIFILNFGSSCLCHTIFTFIVSIGADTRHVLNLCISPSLPACFTFSLLDTFLFAKDLLPCFLLIELLFCSSFVHSLLKWEKRRNTEAFILDLFQLSSHFQNSHSKIYW